MQPLESGSLASCERVAPQAIRKISEPDKTMQRMLTAPRGMGLRNSAGGIRKVPSQDLSR